MGTFIAIPGTFRISVVIRAGGYTSVSVRRGGEYGSFMGSVVREERPAISNADAPEETTKEGAGIVEDWFRCIHCLASRNAKLYMVAVKY